MATSVVLDPAPAGEASAAWSLASRIAFRFVAIYFTLYCLLAQPGVTLVLADYTDDIGDLSTCFPFRPIISLLATRLFHTPSPVLPNDTGSGDRMWDWAFVVLLLIVSTLATMVWSVLDRRRPSYTNLQKWLWLFFAICLAGQMLSYGFAKMLPMQMPRPRLLTLLEPFGNMSPMGVLWSSVGSSPAYEIVCGSAEALGGLLLLIPRTRMLGALVALIDMMFVFTLNMTFDVPVKLLSLHLVVLSLLILAPEFERIIRFFSGQSVAPSMRPRLFQGRRAQRIAAFAQVLIALWLVGITADSARKIWKLIHATGDSPLYGIWDAEQYTVDGVAVPALVSDTNRPRRLLFQEADQALFLRMNDKREWFHAQIDSTKSTIVLNGQTDPKANATFSFVRPAPDRLDLDGTLNGHKVQMQLHAVDLNSFVLLSRGFHWVQEAPFNH